MKKLCHAGHTGQVDLKLPKGFFRSKWQNLKSKRFPRSLSPKAACLVSHEGCIEQHALKYLHTHKLLFLQRGGEAGWSLGSFYLHSPSPADHVHTVLLMQKAPMLAMHHTQLSMGTGCRN